MHEQACVPHRGLRTDGTWRTIKSLRSLSRCSRGAGARGGGFGWCVVTLWHAAHPTANPAAAAAAQFASSQQQKPHPTPLHPHLWHKQCECLTAEFDCAECLPQQGEAGVQLRQDEVGALQATDLHQGTTQTHTAQQEQQGGFGSGESGAAWLFGTVRRAAWLFVYMSACSCGDV